MTINFYQRYDAYCWYNTRIGLELLLYFKKKKIILINYQPSASLFLLSIIIEVKKFYKHKNVDW